MTTQTDRYYAEGYESGSMDLHKWMRRAEKAEARIAALEAGLHRIKAGIEKYATDTVWIGEFETACDAIELLLGPTASDPTAANRDCES